MSYDIEFRVKVDGLDEYVEVGDCDANTTWNVREMIEKSTGLPWLNCENNGLCKDVIPCIEKGMNELIQNGQKYKKYEAPNGWGTVESTIHFFERIIGKWNFFKSDRPELAEIATFWIC